MADHACSARCATWPKCSNMQYRVALDPKRKGDAEKQSRCRLGVELVATETDVQRVAPGANRRYLCQRPDAVEGACKVSTSQSTWTQSQVARSRDGEWLASKPSG